MQLDGWRHVALPVSDLERSVRWYGEVLGATVVKELGQGGDPRDVKAGRIPHTLIDIGGAVINLAETTPVERGDNHFFHYAFSGRADDLDAWMEHLEAAGAQPLGPYGHGGVNVVSIFFEDPDNYRMEINFEFADFEAAKAEVDKRGGLFGNPVKTYEWK